MWTAIAAGTTVGTLALITRGARRSTVVPRQAWLSELRVDAFVAGLICGAVSSLTADLALPPQPLTGFLLAAATTYTARADSLMGQTSRAGQVNRLAHALTGSMAVLAGWLIGSLI